MGRAIESFQSRPGVQRFMQAKPTTSQPQTSGSLILALFMALVIILIGWTLWKTQSLIDLQTADVENRLQQMEIQVREKSKSLSRVQAIVEANQRQLELLQSTLSGLPVGDSRTSAVLRERIATLSEQINQQRIQFGKQQSEIRNIQTLLGQTVMNLVYLANSLNVPSTPIQEVPVAPENLEQPYYEPVPFDQQPVAPFGQPDPNAPFD